MKKILLIVLIILIIIVIGLGVYVFLNFLPQKNNETVEEPQVENGILWQPGDIFITNLKDTKYILKSNIVIEVEDNKSVDLLDKNQPRVRDKIIDILSSVTENDIKYDDIRNKLKNSIKNDLQSMLQIDKIMNVYFIEFVWQ